MMSEARQESQEERILRVMRGILIDVIKDTTTEPGLRHPLKQSTISNIRHGLDLITARQKELIEASGKNWDLRPTYPSAPQQQNRDGVIVPITKAGKKKD